MMKNFIAMNIAVFLAVFPSSASNPGTEDDQPHKKRKLVNLQPRQLFKDTDQSQTAGASNYNPYRNMQSPFTNQQIQDILGTSGDNTD